MRWELLSLFFPILVIQYDSNDENLEHYKNFLIILSFFIIFIYYLRYTGRLSLQTEDPILWIKIRFLKPGEIFFLILLFILINELNLVNHKKKIFKLFYYVLLIVISIFIIISAHRMATILFIVYLVFNIFKIYKNKNYLKIVFYISILFIIIYYILPLYYKELLIISFKNLFFNFDESTGSFRFHDFIYSIKLVINSEDWFFGKFYPLTFYRPYHGSIVKFGIHNIFISTFVNGGLFLLIPLILMWLVLIIYFFRRIINKNILKEEKIAFWWLLLSFIFNNSTNLGIINYFVISYAFLVMKKRKIINLKRNRE